VLYVSLSYATFGLITQDGRIAEAPPIARWTIGKQVNEVAAYYRQKGGTVSALAPRAKYPSASFKEVGQSYSGTVAFPPEDRQATKFQTRELLTWPDGSPVMQTRIVLNLDNDGGQVAVYAQGGSAKAVTAALVEAGAADIEVGGHLAVTFTGYDPESKNPANPRKLYEASYTPPADGEWPGEEEL
jgi:hypothetical protein